MKIQSLSLFALASFSLACGGAGEATEAAADNLYIYGYQPTPPPCDAFYTWAATKANTLQTQWTLTSREIAMASSTVMNGPADRLVGQIYGYPQPSVDFYWTWAQNDRPFVFLDRPAVYSLRGGGTQYLDPVIRIEAARIKFTGVVTECNVAGDVATLVAVDANDTRVTFKMTPGGIIN